jgi:diguanylate cyclase (GGDEF)-like protein/PAS domain S-box-containing protein
MFRPTMSMTLAEGTHGEGSLEALAIEAISLPAVRTTPFPMDATGDNLRRSYEATPAMLHMIDHEGRLLAVSDHWLTCLGYSREEVIGRIVTDFLTPESRQYSQTTVLPSFLLTGRCEEVEYQMIRKDGVTIDVLISAVLDQGNEGGWIPTQWSVAPAQGNSLRILAVVQDITLRRRAERALAVERQALQKAHERFALAADSGGIGIWEWDMATGGLTCDPWMYRLYGLDLKSGGLENYAQWRRRVHGEDIAAAEQAIGDTLEHGSPFDAEYRVVWDDGSVHFIRSSGTVSRDREGHPVRFVGTNREVTEKRLLAAQLAEQHERLRVTLQSIGDGVITADAESRVTWLNSTAELMTGWTSDEGVGMPSAKVFRILNEVTRQTAESPIAGCIRDGASAPLASHSLLVARDGRELGIESSAAPIRSDCGELLGVVLVFRDVTEQRRLSGEMNYRATHDALTGLVNRTEFEHRLQQLLHKAQADRSQNALLYIDLDQFKIVNDTCGHAVGDQLLRRVSSLFANLVRSSDTVARLGGDEFAIILEQAPLSHARHLAQRLCDQMDDFRFSHDGLSFRIGASVGLVAVDGRWHSEIALLQAADTSCYAAKEAGRNRVHEWFETDETIRSRKGEAHWAARLEQALDEDRFQVFAQRIKNLNMLTGRIHAEVLLRMVGDNGSLIAPAAFLPAAERFHLMCRIDRWMMMRVLRWMRSLPSLELVDCLNVNVSGQSVGDRAFQRWAIDRLVEAGPEICRRLCMEITETAVITNLADAAFFIEQLHTVGVRVALDDFGSGASSFGYLKSLPVDSLKIDGQFIRDIVGDPFDEAAVRCFVDIAKLARMKTVAEYVDDAAVLERLNAIGLDFAQGHLIHSPEPIDLLFKAAVGEPSVAGRRP